MKKEVIKARNGTIVELIISENGRCFCPVCGVESKVKNWRPYDQEGLPSYDICTCGFEYGFDDDGQPPYDKSWESYRYKWLNNQLDYSPSASLSPEQKKKQLRNIGH